MISIILTVRKYCDVTKADWLGKSKTSKAAQMSIFIEAFFCQ